MQLTYDKTLSDANTKLRSFNRQFVALIDNCIELIESGDDRLLNDVSDQIARCATTLISPVEYTTRYFYYSRYKEIKGYQPRQTGEERTHWHKIEPYESEQDYQSKNQGENLGKKRFLKPLEQSKYKGVFDAFYSRYAFKNEIWTYLHKMSNTDKHAWIDVVKIDPEEPVQIKWSQFIVNTQNAVVGANSDMLQFQVMNRLDEDLTGSISAKTFGNWAMLRANLGLRHLDSYQCLFVPNLLNETVVELQVEGIRYIVDMFCFLSSNGICLLSLDIDGMKLNPIEILIKSYLQAVKACLQIMLSCKLSPLPT